MRWRYERCGNERTKMRFTKLHLWIPSSINASNVFVCIECLDQDSFKIRKRIRATVFLQKSDLNLRIQGLKGIITNLPKIDSSGCRMGRPPSQRISAPIAPLKSEFWDFKSEFPRRIVKNKVRTVAHLNNNDKVAPKVTIKAPEVPPEKSLYWRSCNRPNFSLI